MATVQNLEVVTDTFDVDKICILLRNYSPVCLSRLFPLLSNVNIITVIIFNIFHTARSKL
jgi:hypothetical protein